jgi:putative methyltransferase (TIGR04325 family)
MSLAHWIPPVLVPAIRHWTGLGLRFEGNFPDFGKAMNAAAGYDDAKILEKVVSATRLVVSGSAAAERDGILLTDEQPPWFAIAGLASAVRDPNNFHVVDFGGSLGSVYRVAKAYLPGLTRWTVIEQPHYVAAGIEFADGELAFEESFSAAARASPIDAVLFSSVLQYLPDPAEACTNADESGANRIIIDRTPFWQGLGDKYTVQKLPRRWYGADYACRIFDEHSLAMLLPNWRVVAQRICEEGQYVGANAKFNFRGYILERK